MPAALTLGRRLDVLVVGRTCGLCGGTIHNGLPLSWFDRIHRLTTSS